MAPRSGFGVRPRSLGELLDLTFRVYRARFLPLAAVGVATTTLALALSLVYQAWIARAVQSAGSDPGLLLTQFAAGMLLLFPLVIGIQAVGSLPMLALTADALAPTDRRASAVVRHALRRAIPGVVTSLLVSLLVMVGLILCFLPGIVLSLGLVLALPLVYTERLGPFAAISRSWTLVFQRGNRELSAQSNWVRVLVVGVVALVVIYALNVLSSIPQGVAQAVAVMRGNPAVETAMGPQPMPLSVMLPVYFLGAVIQGIFQPIGVVPWPILYYDIRTRHEGLDLEWTIDRLREGDASGDGTS